MDILNEMHPKKRHSVRLKRSSVLIKKSGHGPRQLGSQVYPSRKHLRTKVTPGLHLTYSRNGELWGWY